MKKIILICIGILAGASLYAQNPDSITIDDYYVDFSVPDITAFSILDINSNDVVRPGNVKELAVGIQNYVDQDGNLKPGLAMEIAPYRILAKALKVRSFWEKNKSLKNLQISIGTAQGDSSNLLAAWGINWTPIDRTDPVANIALQNFFADYLANKDSIANQMSLAGQRNKHLQSVNQFLNSLTPTSRLSSQTKVAILQYFGGGYRSRLLRYDSTDNQLYALVMKDTVLQKLGTFNINLDSAQSNALSMLIVQNAKLTFTEQAEEEEFAENFSEELKRQKKIFIEENWNRLVIQLKAGSKYNSAENTIKDLSLLNWRIFGGIAGRIPGLANSNSTLAKSSQVIYQASYINYKDKSMPLKWEFSTGGRLLLGKADKRLSAEFLYSQATINGETTDKSEYIRYTIGGEMKINEGLWLELAVGGQKFLQGNDDTRVVPQFGLKYAIQKKSRF
ncbi:hypothetical protein [Ohtaekwangia koreensis]|uniref:Uncharacterized protein n=1 Tax=Ohtaekwangia koreensis TaxID=688867 RepID=A0A1T5ISK9_9BACT|nr:hypothetical protein [Ohtaekwangia koreensis]SKC42161.1 hypothetical protein SAMN05660236_0355 [Ohtaekwangia koreensis]